MPNSRQGQADYVLLGAVSALLLFGLIMLTSASSSLGHERFGDSYFFIKRQLTYGVFPGLVLFIILAKVPYQLYKRFMWQIFGIMILLLILVFIPGIGSTLNTGAHSWLVIAGVSVQPSEFAKLGLILFGAGYLTAVGQKIEIFNEGFLPALVFLGIPVALVILQPDIGTVSILFAILYGLLFFAQARLSHLGLLAGLGIAGLMLMVAIAPYRAARLTTFLHPELDPQGIGYHINQAFLAIGSGGLFGLGLGHSRQKFQYLPEVHGDSIFAVIAEEMGFVVVIGLLALIIFIGKRGLLLAQRAPDIHSKLIVSGITVWLLAQSFLNIGAMVGLLPITGVPLPFISHGGTSLMVAMASIGILMNVSKQARL